MRRLGFEYDDGGRAEAGYRGIAGDCVVRALAIGTGRPYRDVYRELALPGHSPRNGVSRDVYEPWLFDHGFAWTPTMTIGSGCRVHMRADELPTGIVVCRVSKHLCTVIDGVIYDTYDPSRQGTRCVYGYYQI